jgi:hypothetical protein
VVQYSTPPTGSIDANGVYTAGPAEGGPFDIVARVSIDRNTFVKVAQVWISSAQTGIALGSGPIDRFLALTMEGSPVISGQTAVYPGGEAMAHPAEAEKAAIGAASYTWTAMRDADGVWSSEFNDVTAFYSLGMYSLTDTVGYFEYTADDRLQVWLNGERVISEDALVVGQKQSDLITLRKGLNQLFVRHYGGEQPNFFSLRVINENGIPFENLSYEPFASDSLPTSARPGKVRQPGGRMSFLTTTKSALIVNHQQEGEWQLRLFSLDGKMVFEARGTRSRVLRYSRLPCGGNVYIAQLKTPRGMTVSPCVSVR